MKDALRTVETLRNIMLARATGGEAAVMEYRELREAAIQDLEISSLLPEFVHTCLSLDQFWAYIKMQSPTWAQRREHIWNAFLPVLRALGSSADAPIGAEPPPTVSGVDALCVQPSEKVNIPQRDRRPLVVFVHGIRTDGAWMHRIKPLLDPEYCVTAQAGYGFFNLFRFLIPGLRKGAIASVEERIEHAISHHGRHRDLVIVAHSFGTHAVTDILKRSYSIQPARMLFCGSIVDQNFSWSTLRQFPPAGSGITWVVNECGTRDIWPSLAYAMTWGYGKSGTYGFQIAGVEDRRHNVKHSEFFTDAFVKKFWIPFLTDGLVVPSEHVGTTSWLKHVVGLRPGFPWIFWIVLMLLFVASAAAWPHVSHLMSGSAPSSIDQEASEEQRTDFEITRLETSIRNSIYYEWDKLSKEQQPHNRKTQFSDPQYRQFRYNEIYGDDFGRRPTQGIVLTLLTIQYALAKLELPEIVRSKFTDYLVDNPDSKERLKNFFWTLIPAQRFHYEQYNGESILIPFVQGTDPEHQWFLRALEHLHDNSPLPSSSYYGKTVKQSAVEALVKEHFALFNLGFLPVFEVYVRANGTRPITIDKISAEVLDIAEYLGGAEAVPASRVITIPIAYKKGLNERFLAGDEQIYVRPSEEVRVLIRLEPQEKQSSYLIRLHIHANDLARQSEVFAVDM